MNKYLLILLLFLLNLNLLAQTNLVPNPSFEVLDSCPDGSSQIDRATGWAPFTSSPDLYHVCGFIFSDPCPATGNAFVRIFCKNKFPNSNEIFGIELIDSLIIGTKYYISFKVNLANNAKCGIDKLGARFSIKKYCYSLNDTTNLCDSTPATINNFAHIYSTQIITDTINWTIIWGSFVADSNYKYIMIGHFFDTAATNITLIPPNISCNGVVAYFVDDICVSTDSLTCVDITNEIIDFSSDSITIQESSCINFNVNTVVDYDFYGWQFTGAIPPTSTDSMPTNICYDTAGVYDVILIASDSSGCGDTIVKTNYITVEQGSDIFDVNGFKIRLQIYPNPTSGNITLKYKLPPNADNRVSVYNVLGKLVYEGKAVNRQIDLSGLSGGLYLLQVEVGEIVFRKRVIKL